MKPALALAFLILFQQQSCDQKMSGNTLNGTLAEIQKYFPNATGTMEPGKVVVVNTGVQNVSELFVQETLQAFIRERAPQPNQNIGLTIIGAFQAAFYPNQIVMVFNGCGDHPALAAEYFPSRNSGRVEQVSSDRADCQ
jgi:uncharacterized protein YlzI (FlbEa/FlbD family)